VRVRVESGNEGLVASLREADDFKSFCVEIPVAVRVDAGVSTSEGAVEFASADEAWVDRRWLVEAGEFHSGTAAGESFEAMVAFAAERGWLDPGSGRIAAHVERV
jgi:hypothetical protein